MSIILVFITLGVVLTETLKLLLDLVKAFLEDSLLQNNFVFNVVTILLKGPLFGFNESVNSEDLGMALSDGLGLVVAEGLVAIVIEEAEPVNEVSVLINDLLAAVGLEILELLLTLDKDLCAVISTRLAHVNHAFDA